MKKKEYMKPQMEAMEIKLQGMIANSPTDPGYGGSGSGSSDAPAMPDFDEFESQFDFKLW